MLLIDGFCVGFKDRDYIRGYLLMAFVVFKDRDYIRWHKGLGYFWAHYTDTWSRSGYTHVNHVMGTHLYPPPPAHPRWSSLPTTTCCLPGAVSDHQLTTDHWVCRASQLTVPALVPIIAPSPWSTPTKTTSHDTPWLSQPSIISILCKNLRGFRASVNPTFEGGILDFIGRIPDVMDNFNMAYRKVHWQNPKLKSLNSILLQVIHHGEKSIPSCHKYNKPIKDLLLNRHVHTASIQYLLTAWRRT